MRSRLLCAAGAIVLVSAIPGARPASAQGLNDVIRKLDNAISPDDARRKDQVRRRDSRPDDGP
jgi:hypothetical protein